MEFQLRKIQGNANGSLDKIQDNALYFKSIYLLTNSVFFFLSDLKHSMVFSD